MIVEISKVQNMKNNETHVKTDDNQCSSDSQLNEMLVQLKHRKMNIYYSRWKSEYRLRSKEKKVKLSMKQIYLNIYMNKWKTRYSQKQINAPNMNEFNRIKKIEQIGYDYQRQIFLRKFLLIWSNKAHMKIEERKRKEIEEANMNPHLKIKLHKHKLVKKAPPPPIVVNENIEEMIKQNKEIQENKMKKIKKQIKQDKIKQLQIEKENEEKERKKRMIHLKNLQKQKLERQNQIKAEEEKVRNQRIYSELCSKAEFHYQEMLKHRMINQWSKILEYRFYQEEQCRNYLKVFTKKLYFEKMKSIFLYNDDEKMISASNYYNIMLMKRTIKAAQKVIEDRNNRINNVIKNSHFHLIHFCMNEWKSKLIAQNRLNNLKALDFYEKMLLKKAFKAFQLGKIVIADETKQNDLKNKLLEKAHQYWNENKLEDDNLLRITLDGTMKNENSTNYLQDVTDAKSNDENGQPNNDNRTLNDSLKLSLNLADQHNNSKSEDDSDDFF